MNKKDLKKISQTFRTFAKQTINAHYTDIGSRLSQLVNYVNDTSLLHDYVNDCITMSSNENIEEEIEKVINSFGHEYFDLGETKETVTARTYQIMKYLSGKTEQILHFGLGICKSTKYQDCAKEFGTYIVQQFATHIVLFLNSMMIDMGLDENTQYNITVNGGQVNISQDNSTLNTTFNNNGLSIEKTMDLANYIYNIIAQKPVPDDNENMIKETLDEILDEMKQQFPKRKLVRVLLDSLNTTSSLITLSTALSTAVNAFTKYLAPFFI